MLPQQLREEFQREQAVRHERILARRRSTLARYLVEGVVLFVALEFFFHGLTPLRLLFLFAPGVALGWACARMRAGKTAYTVAGAVAYLVVYGPWGLVAFWHFVVFVVLAGAAGVMHELQRADGSEM
jgi:hypothetical protein